LIGRAALPRSPNYQWAARQHRPTKPNTICTLPELGYIKAMKANIAAQALLLAVLFPAVAFIAGCKTTSSVDWNSRVGVYTFNQAVADLGPPNKQAKLSDGKTVDQWITLHGSNGAFMGGGLNNNFGMGAGQTIAQSYKDHVLELTFGPDGKLVSWAKNY
jgi:hypothetical protein